MRVWSQKAQRLLSVWLFPWPSPERSWGGGWGDWGGGPSESHSRSMWWGLYCDLKAGSVIFLELRDQPLVLWESWDQRSVSYDYLFRLRQFQTVAQAGPKFMILQSAGIAGDTTPNLSFSLK